MTNARRQSMRARIGRPTNRRQAFRRATATAVTVMLSSDGPRSARDTTTAGFFLEGRGGGHIRHSKSITVNRINRIGIRV